MGLFESNPWILVPIVIVIVEGWGAVKRLFAHHRDPLPDGTWMVAGENDIHD